MVSLNFYVLLALPSQRSVCLKLCIIPLCIFYYVGYAAVSGTYPYPPGLIKRSYHSWLSLIASSEGPTLQPCLAPQSLSPPLSTTFWTCEIKSTHLSASDFDALTGADPGAAVMAIAHPKTYECNFIHCDFVNLENSIRDTRRSLFIE